MRLSEIVLRLSCHLVGWLMIYSHCIWLGVIPVIGCGPEGEELFRLSLVFAPVVIGAAMLLGLASKLSSVVGYLRWLALPLVLLVPLAFIPIPAALLGTTIGGNEFCSSISTSGWKRLWAPLQLVTLCAIVVAAARFVTKPGVSPG